VRLWYFKYWMWEWIRHPIWTWKRRRAVKRAFRNVRSETITMLYPHDRHFCPKCGASGYKYGVPGCCICDDLTSEKKP
jgi:hypothetical protein